MTDDLTRVRAGLYTEAERQDAYAKGWADAKSVHGDALREALDWFEEREARLDYWQKGTGHRNRLLADLTANHGRDFARNTDNRIEAVVQEALRAFIDRAALRGDNP